MVHCIRFLKYPYLVRAELPADSVILKTKITITTDLGESFYPGNVCVYVFIARDTAAPTRLGTVHWKSGNRILEIEMSVSLGFFSGDGEPRFHFTCNQSGDLDVLQIDRLPEIISAWTDKFPNIIESDGSEVLRRFRIPDGRISEIYEATRETIAHHIWDGGLVLTAWLLSCPEQLKKSIGECCTILELGTGCGIVSLAFGAIMRYSSFILTDVDEHTLGYARRNALVAPGAWQLAPLDWTKPHDFKLSQDLDFIIASECIYNSDSIPDLIRTLSHLAKQSGVLAKGQAWPKLILSTKVRHHSEGIFFQEMNQSGFRKEYHARIPLPDSYRESIGQELEQVDIYIFEFKLTY
ncbi:MAG: hypothetical protein Q9220_001628 [cf. Caloplaca sp. 1 TL-2023]